MHGNIREGRDNLLFWRQICAFLELKIADSSAERKVAIDSAKVDESTCSLYPCFFALILWLVVERKRLRAAFDTEDRSRVARIALLTLAF